MQSRDGRRYSMIMLITGLWLAVLTALKLSGSTEAPRLMAQAEPPAEKCQPYEYKDSEGHCKDLPDVLHHRGPYEPRAGEQCWTECLCHQGQSPADVGCGSCSYVGMVCR